MKMMQLGLYINMYSYLISFLLFFIVNSVFIILCPLAVDVLFKIFFNCDMAQNFQINFQEPATVAMNILIDLHNDIFYFLVTILFFVIGFWNILIKSFGQFEDFYKINYKKVDNSFFIIQRPGTLVYNEVLEIIWTVVPCIILLLIAMPSLTFLFVLESAVYKPWVSFRIIGNQWYWSYEFTYHNGFDVEFENILVTEEDLSTCSSFADLNPFRLLRTDFYFNIPLDTPIRFLITSNDVLHSWAVPSFGIKMDACPGRLNEVFTSINPNAGNLHFGQCSEICGINHAFMPIAVRTLPKSAFTLYLFEQFWAENGIEGQDVSKVKTLPTPPEYEINFEEDSDTFKFFDLPGHPYIYYKDRSFLQLFIYESMNRWVLQSPAGRAFFDYYSLFDINADAWTFLLDNIIVLSKQFGSDVNHPLFDFYQFDTGAGDAYRNFVDAYQHALASYMLEGNVTDLSVRNYAEIKHVVHDLSRLTFEMMDLDKYEDYIKDYPNSPYPSVLLDDKKIDIINSKQTMKNVETLINPWWGVRGSKENIDNFAMHDSINFVKTHVLSRVMNDMFVNGSFREELIKRLSKLDWDSAEKTELLPWESSFESELSEAIHVCALNVMYKWDYNDIVWGGDQKAQGAFRVFWHVFGSHWGHSPESFEKDFAANCLKMSKGGCATGNCAEGTTGDLLEDIQSVSPCATGNCPPTGSTGQGSPEGDNPCATGMCPVNY